MSEFRRKLEDVVLARFGEVDVLAAAAINTACRAESACLLLGRWLRLRADVMSDADRLNYVTAIARASAERDKALAKLRLDAAADPMQALLAQFKDVPLEAPQQPAAGPEAVDPIQETPQQPDATEAPTAIQAEPITITEGTL